MKTIFGIISVIAFIFDLIHIFNIVTSYNLWVVSGTMSTKAYYTDLTNSLLLLIPIVFVLILVSKS